MTISALGPLLAQGRTAEVFAWQDGQILKLFYDWCPPTWVQHEIDMGHYMATTPLPTPKLLDTVEVDGRRGMIYERVDAVSMLKVCNTKPWLLWRMARQLADLHTVIHEQPGTGLPSLTGDLHATIDGLDALSADLKAQVLARLPALPETQRLCHFDFHPDQVLITPTGAVILDWMTARQGPPLADVARTALLLQIGQLPYGGRALQLAINFWRKAFLRAYLARYLALHPSVTQQSIRTWLIPVAAARLREGIPGEQETLLTLIQAYLAE